FGLPCSPGTYLGIRELADMVFKNLRKWWQPAVLSIRRGQRPKFRPKFETLEDRTVLTVINVTSTAAGLGANTLGAAILQANLDGSGDTIVLATNATFLMNATTFIDSTTN